MDGTEFGFICLAICIIVMAVEIRRLRRRVDTLERWRGVGGKVEGDKR